MKLENIKEKYFSLNNYIYYLFCVYMATLMLSNSTIYMTNDVFNLGIKLIRYVCYLGFAISIILDLKKGQKITYKVVILWILAILIFLFSKNKNIAFLALVLTALRNVDITELIKKTLKVYIVLFAIVIISSFLKIIPEWTYTRGDEIRYSLGFFYSTITIGFYLSIILMYFYVRRDNCKLVEVIILEVFNVLLFMYTDGRLSFILITFALTLMYISKFKITKKVLSEKHIKAIMKFACYVLPILLVICTVLLTCLYASGNEFAYEVNKALSGRLKHMSNAYVTYGVTPFGQEIEWNGNGGHGYIDLDDKDFVYNYVDNSYARVMFDYGVIFLGLVIASYTIVLVREFKKENYWLVSVLFFVLIWSFIEPYLVGIEKNVFVLAMIPFLHDGEYAISLPDIKKKIKGDGVS